MFLINKYSLLFTIFILVVLMPFRASGEVVDVERDWKSGWSVTGFNGWFTEDATVGESLTFGADMDSNYRFAGVALNKRLLTLWSRLDVEGEFQVLKHYGSQHQGEFVGLAAVRWRTFPWDRWLQTGIAFGVGASVATEEPEYELKNKGETSNVLAYILFEGELGLRRYPRWTVVGRIHHRSTAFNTFTDGHASSNAYALGLKYRF